MNHLEYYSPFNTNYERDGDVTLIPTKAKFRIKLNGICEIEVEHPYDKEGRWKLLSNDGVIKAPTPYSQGQLFGIYKIKKNMKKGLIIKARHIFFDLYKSTTEDIRAINKTCKEALDILLKGTKFTGYSDIYSANTCYFVKQNRVQAINGSDDNTLINRWGGELFLDNYDITVNSHIGDDYGVEILYGTNMLDIGLTDDKENVVTRGKPVAFEGRRLPELYIDSPIIDRYREVNEAFIDMSDLKLKADTSDGDEGFDTEEELYAAMRSRMAELYEGGLDKPTISGTVKVAPLENTEKYKYVSNLTNIGLGDTVTAHYKELEIDIKIRCIGYTWDILTRKYEDVTLGDYVKNYFEKQSDISNRIDKILNKNGSVKSESLEGTINAIKAQFKAMRDIAQPQQVRAILFEDKIKGSATYGAMCLGSMGFEIASERTPDDRDWDWRTFGTGAGFTADCINVGTLNANLIKAGILSAIVIQDIHETFTMDLREKGSLKFKNNGNLAMEFIRNELKMFNWANKKEYIGSLVSLATTRGDKIPYLGLTNEKNSGIEIAYRISDGTFLPYIFFDKYNVKGDQYYPISIREDVSVSRLFLGHSSIKNLPRLIGWGNGIDIQKEGNTLAGFDFNDNTFTVKNLEVLGNKNCIQRTQNFGDVPFYSNEDINSLLTKTEIDTIFETKLYESGKYKCSVSISQLIKETINTEISYNVWISKLDQGDIWISNTYPGYFVVESDRPVRFKYKLEGRRKGFEEMREELTLKKAYETKVKGGTLGGTSKEN